MTTNKKMYYDCPIASAYMAKNFGVNFGFNGHVYYGWSVEMQMPLEKYYVAEDSLHLFEPMAGDFALFKHGNKPSDFTAGIIPTIQDQPNGRIRLWGCLATEPSNKNIQIIKRNNRPFITPEIEDGK